MKLSRREALVGALATAVAPKDQLKIVQKPIKPVARPLRNGWSAETDPWAGALDHYEVHNAIMAILAQQIAMAILAQQIAEEEDRRILGELTGEDPGPAGNRCVPETG